MRLRAELLVGHSDGISPLPPGKGDGASPAARADWREIAHMPRIRPLPKDEAHPDATAFYDQDEQRHGLVLNPTPIMAYRPSILAASRGLDRSMRQEAVLSAELRALVCTRVAQLIGCPF